MSESKTGTTKFEIHFYNARNIRGTKVSKPIEFVYRQYGVIQLKEGTKVLDYKQFNTLATMENFINHHMAKIVKANLRAKSI